MSDYQSEIDVGDSISNKGIPMVSGCLNSGDQRIKHFHQVPVKKSYRSIFGKSKSKENKVST